MTTPPFDYERFCDHLGPQEVVHLHDPVSGLRAIVVVDNVACGPSVGGVRMAPDVTLDDTKQLFLDDHYRKRRGDS